MTPELLSVAGLIATPLFTISAWLISKVIKHETWLVDIKDDMKEIKSDVKTLLTR